MDLETEFGGIDIYLFDQLLRGRITPRDRVFDAGCGWGRNLVYLFRGGFDVHAVDPDPDAIAAVRELAGRLAPSLPAGNFRVEPVERASMPDASASVVISSAVLHFARDDAEFEAMLAGSWRVLAPGGLFFCRLASSIGFESRVERIGSAAATGCRTARRGIWWTSRSSWRGRDRSAVACSIRSRPPSSRISGR